MNASFAALLVTITSAIVSSLATIRLFEMGKTKEHEGRLFEKRSECYPILYKLLSDFIKILEFGTLTENGLDKSFTKDRILEHMRQLEPWDSAYSILVSDYTIDLLLVYRSSLYKLLEVDDHNFARDFCLPDSPDKQHLINQTRELEAAIRWEMRTYRYLGKEYRSYQKDRIKHFRNRKSPISENLLLKRYR
jgi:hypothetical protein